MSVFFFPFTSKAVWKFSWKLLNYDNCFTVVLCLFDFSFIDKTHRSSEEDFGGLWSYFWCLYKDELEISEHNFKNSKHFKAQDSFHFHSKAVCSDGGTSSYLRFCLHSFQYLVLFFRSADHFVLLIISAFISHTMRRMRRDKARSSPLHDCAQTEWQRLQPKARLRTLIHCQSQQATGVTFSAYVPDESTVTSRHFHRIWTTVKITNNGDNRF